MFRFVHAADLHLDSPFRGLSLRDEATGGRMRRATFDAFERLIELTLEEKVDFLLVAGDVYDGADRSLRAQLAFRDGLARLAAAEIPSFVVHGNHDPLDGWIGSLAWPEGVTIFGCEEPRRVRLEIQGRPRVEISGISYRSAREDRLLHRLLQPGDAELFQIALLHAHCGGSDRHEPYVPCSPDELAEGGFDYWALGHVHERTDWDRGARIVYPGNLQGRSIREPGPRGALLVEVDELGSSRLAFRALDTVRWQQAELDLSPLQTLDELDAAFDGSLRELSELAEGRPTMARILLTGSGPLYPDLRRPGALGELTERVRLLGQALNPPVWLESMPNRSIPELDVTQHRDRDDLLGHVLREAERLRTEPDTIGQLLRPLFDHHLARQLLETPDLDSLLQEAERLCIDLLEEKE